MKTLNKASSINLGLALATLIFQGVCLALYFIMSRGAVEEARVGFLALAIPGGLVYLLFLVGFWIFLLLWKERTKRILVENVVISLVGGFLNLLLTAYAYLGAVAVARF